MSTQTIPPFNFENALSELESLVEKLGKGQVSLEEALKSFEQGIGLARQCNQVLQEAEQKVETLLSYQEPLQTIPFKE